MNKNVRNKNFSRKNEKIHITNKINDNISVPKKALMKEVEKSKKEALKTSVPINYIKVDENITTTVYHIPIDKNILKDNDVIFRKHYVLKTINNDKLHHSPKKNKNNFPFKPFSSKEMGYKYYKQKLSPSYPRDNSKKYLYLRKSKSPEMQTSYISTRMNSLDNKEQRNIRNRFRYKSAENSLRNKNLNNPFYQRFLNNKRKIFLNNNKSRSRIRHRIISLNRSNDFMNNIFHIKPNINNNNYNACENYELNNSNHNRSLNQNMSNNNRKIDLDLHIINNTNSNIQYNDRNNISNKNIYSIDNSFIFRSPKNRQVKSMYFINDKYIDSPSKFVKYENWNGGKIMKSLEKNKSKDGKYVISTTLLKKIYDNLEENDNNDEIEEIKVIENDDVIYSRKLSQKKDLGDNYKYYQRADIKSPLRFDKNNINYINHIRRSPVHVYGYENYIIKDNKKIYLKSPPIKGKLIRIYRNNENKNKNCNICLMKSKEKKRLGHFSNVKENTILLPSKFKKGEFNHYIK